MLWKTDQHLEFIIKQYYKVFRVIASPTQLQVAAQRSRRSRVRWIDTALRTSQVDRQISNNGDLLKQISLLHSCYTISKFE